VVAFHYAKFDLTVERPDVLALNPDGKLIVIELKRNSADKATDFQAVKYASYRSTTSVDELQQDHRAFWNNRCGEDDQLSPEAVGERFGEFLKVSIIICEVSRADDTPTDEPSLYGTLANERRLVLGRGFDIILDEGLQFDEELLNRPIAE
jgi:hypothetical protein